MKIKNLMNKKLFVGSIFLSGMTCGYMLSNQQSTELEKKKNKTNCFKFLPSSTNTVLAYSDNLLISYDHQKRNPNFVIERIEKENVNNKENKNDRHGIRFKRDKKLIGKIKKKILHFFNLFFFINFFFFFFFFN